MNKRNRKVLSLLCGFLLLGANPLLAQDKIQFPEKDKTKLVYQIRAGVNIGGFSPLPMPNEIRKISGFSPRFNTGIEGNITKWFGNEVGAWGIRGGIKLESKGMRTDAEVKNYGMEIIGEGGERVAGNWTGAVSTHVDNSYATLPITAVYQLRSRWELSAGLFASYLMEREFSGYVSNGYLREGGPTGEKVVFEGENTASYDFSNNLTRFSYGAQVGASWKASEHLIIFSDFTFGFNDMFESEFKTIPFAMSPIYLNIGFGYEF